MSNKIMKLIYYLKCKKYRENKNSNVACTYLNMVKCGYLNVVS